MKIAIHHRVGSFSEQWISYFDSKAMPYKIVNAFDNNIIEQLDDCDAFMWHHHHGNQSDRLIAQKILYALQQGGKIVYPDFNTAWHFDDKVAQKYLLEAIDAPLVPSYVFFDKNSALKWTEQTAFPKVFKLRGGAGSSNVMLIKNRTQAKKIINRCFSRGFKEIEICKRLKYQFNKFKVGQISLCNYINYSLSIIKSYFTEVNNREYGYAYFQEFMPGNTFDYRIVVINEKYAVGEKRYTRTGDFRASGSGKFDYSDIDIKAVEIAFNVAKKLKLQTVAFDLIYGPDKSLKIVELCYGFGTHGIVHAPGYWTSDLQWHNKEDFNLFGQMVENVISLINDK